MSYVEYNSNNSGGSWWLKDEDWKALEQAGWIVVWASLEHEFDPRGDYVRNENGIPKLVPIGSSGKRQYSWRKPDENGVYRNLGAMAQAAYKPNCADLMEAVKEWERITGASSTDAGCPCCGNPHNFTLYDDAGDSIASGPSAAYVASW